MSIYIADFLREAHERHVRRKIREAAEAATAAAEEAAKENEARAADWWNRRQNSLASGEEFDEEPPFAKKPEPEKEEEIDVSELTKEERRIFEVGRRLGVRDTLAEQFERKLIEQARKGNESVAESSNGAK